MWQPAQEPSRVMRVPITSRRGGWFGSSGAVDGQTISARSGNAGVHASEVTEKFPMQFVTALNRTACRVGQPDGNPFDWNGVTRCGEDGAGDRHDGRVTAIVAVTDEARLPRSMEFARRHSGLLPAKTSDVLVVHRALARGDGDRDDERRSGSQREQHEAGPRAAHSNVVSRPTVAMPAKRPRMKR